MKPQGPVAGKSVDLANPFSLGARQDARVVGRRPGYKRQQKRPGRSSRDQTQLQGSSRNRRQNLVEGQAKRAVRSGGFRGSAVSGRT